MSDTLGCETFIVDGFGPEAPAYDATTCWWGETTLLTLTQTEINALVWGFVSVTVFVVTFLVLLRRAVNRADGIPANPRIRRFAFWTLDRLSRKAVQRGWFDLSDALEPRRFAPLAHSVGEWSFDEADALEARHGDVPCYLHGWDDCSCLYEGLSYEDLYEDEQPKYTCADHHKCSPLRHDCEQFDPAQSI